MDLEAPKTSIQDYCFKIKKLKFTDVNELNKILDQLNSSRSFSYNNENKVYDDLLCCLGQVIPSRNDHILSKFSCLIYFLVHKQKILLQATSVEYLIEFLLNAIRSCGEWVQCDVIIALSAVLENSTDKIGKFYEPLIGKNGILLALSCNNDKSIQYNAFQCIYNILRNPYEILSSNESLDLCYQRCLSVLKEKSLFNSPDILTLKIVINSLKCLQHIFQSKNMLVENFGELLGILKSLLFYGLPGQTVVTDTNLYPTLCCPVVTQHQESQSESDSPHPKLRKQKRNKRRLKRTPQKKQTDFTSTDDYSRSTVTNLSSGMAAVSFASTINISSEPKIKSSSSDSELSDVDNHISKMKSLQTSVRQNSYIALQCIVKTADKKVIFGYWSSFLPEHAGMQGIIFNQNIFTTILKDPAPQVRLSALSLLAEFLRGSKLFLSHADQRNVKQMSFTSLSSILTTMICEIHRCLLLALLSENSTNHLIQILKCYAVLAENVPYSKLNKDILFKFLRHAKGFLCHKDIQVQIASMTFFCCLVNSEQTPPEVEELMLSPDFECPNSGVNENLKTCSSQLKMCTDELPWIIVLCQKSILNEEPLPIKIQSLQLLTTIVGKYFNKSKPFFLIIESVVLHCLNNPDSSLQLHGAKLLDIVGRCMNNITHLETKEILQPLVSLLWQKVLNGPLIKCLTNDDIKTLTSVCCDCLSTLPSSDFEALAPRQQIMYMTMLLGLAADSNPNVKGAAIRCLGLFCLFPSLVQDQSFLDDVSAIIRKSVKDMNVNVRFKASWSLGNLSDALFLNRHKCCPSWNLEMKPEFFYFIGMTCIHFSNDCDRVKANAVRALGNLLNYIPEEFVSEPTIQEFIQESCGVLKLGLSANFMKVCWNSCYALGNMLKNTYLIQSNAVNLGELLQCLLETLKSPNFKVRISATQALTILTSRSLYGNLFPVIWQHLITALSSTETDVNFKEIKHQENLCEQLCFSLCQLTVLINFDDVLIIEDEVMQAREMLLTSMWKFGSHMTSEKSTVVSTALENLTALKDASMANDCNSLAVLIDILNQAIIAYYAQDDC